MSDPLDELRSDWARLQPPACDPEPDALTAAVLDWSRQAWQSLESSSVVLPQRWKPARRRRPLRSTAARLSGLALAAAAGLLVWFVLHPQAPETTPAPELVAPNESLHTLVADGSPMPAQVLPDGSVELKRGRVRLILLNDPQELNR